MRLVAVSAVPVFDDSGEIFAGVDEGKTGLLVIECSLTALRNRAGSIFEHAVVFPADAAKKLKSEIEEHEGLKRMVNSQALEIEELRESLRLANMNPNERHAYNADLARRRLFQANDGEQKDD